MLLLLSKDGDKNEDVVAVAVGFLIEVVGALWRRRRVEDEEFGGGGETMRRSVSS